LNFGFTTRSSTWDPTLISLARLISGLFFDLL
jgi:hypothetical protein